MSLYMQAPLLSNVSIHCSELDKIKGPADDLVVNIPGVSEL